MLTTEPRVIISISHMQKQENGIDCAASWVIQCQTMQGSKNQYNTFLVTFLQKTCFFLVIKMIFRLLRVEQSFLRRK